MKAYIYKEYGAPEVLKVTNINIPIPKDNELLIKVIAVAVTTGDVRFRKADPFLIRFMNGLSTPNKQILGMHISGSVEKIGKAVTKFKKGDKIYGSLEMSFGAYAEYVCIPENNPIELKPENYSFSEAAAIIFGATTAHHFLKH
jgi:NADPH:quinone reductase-like Zn-dependent oxidoreductase